MKRSFLLGFVTAFLLAASGLRAEDAAGGIKAAVDAFCAAAKAKNGDEMKRLTGQWDIPNSDDWFKTHWGGDRGSKLAKGYASCQKYRNFETSEMTYAYTHGLVSVVRLLDSKQDGMWCAALQNAFGDGVPLFVVQNLDPNTGKSAWGDMPFAFMDGTFRMMGLYGYVVLGSGIPKEEFPLLVQGKSDAVRADANLK